MPLSVLLCEGQSNGEDVRLLSCILQGFDGRIRPAGAKGYLPIILDYARRHDRQQIAAIRDGDWDGLDLEAWRPATEARPWHVNGEARGWIWGRKEVEGYLLDPGVLRRAFDWSDPVVNRYRDHLSAILDALHLRTAARIALSASRPAYDYAMGAPFGPQIPDDGIEQEIRRRTERTRERATLDVDALLDRWRANAPLLRPGGRCHSLDLFAGEDIFAAFSQRRGIRQDDDPKLRLLWNRERFVEEVLTGLEGYKGAEPPHTWLPEWASLREAVLAA